MRQFHRIYGRAFGHQSRMGAMLTKISTDHSSGEGARSQTRRTNQNQFRSNTASNRLPNISCNHQYGGLDLSNLLLLRRGQQPTYSSGMKANGRGRISTMLSNTAALARVLEMYNSGAPTAFWLPDPVLHWEWIRPSWDLWHPRSLWLFDGPEDE